MPTATEMRATSSRRASALLSVGRVDEARADLARATELDPNDSDAYALNAVIDVAQNNRDAPSKTPAGPCRWRRSRCPPAWPSLTLCRRISSWRQRATSCFRWFRTTPAGDRPEHALALARLAELWLSLGYVGKALEAATRAALAPDLARAHIVLGFVELTRVRTSAAKAAFERAIALESKQPARALWSRPGEDPRRGFARRPPRHRDRGGARRRGRSHPQLSWQGVLRGEARRLTAEQFALAKRLTHAIRHRTFTMRSASRRSTGLSRRCMTCRRRST